MGFQQLIKAFLVSILFSHPKQSIKITLRLLACLRCYIARQYQGTVANPECLGPLLHRGLQLCWHRIQHHFHQHHQFDQLQPLQWLGKTDCSLLNVDAMDGFEIEINAEELTKNQPQEMGLKVGVPGVA